MAQLIDSFGYNGKYPFTSVQINRKRLNVYEKTLNKLQNTFGGNINDIIQYIAHDGIHYVLNFLLRCIMDEFLPFRVKNINCSWNPKTSVTIATCHKTEQGCEIEVSKQIFAYGVDYDSGNEVNKRGNVVYRQKYESKKVFGIPAYNSLQILLVILEHELCHALLQIYSNRRDQSTKMDLKLIRGHQCDLHHNIYFTDLSKRLFGHNMIVARVGMVGKRRSSRKKRLFLSE